MFLLSCLFLSGQLLFVDSCWSPQLLQVGVVEMQYFLESPVFPHIKHLPLVLLHCLDRSKSETFLTLLNSWDKWFARESAIPNIYVLWDTLPIKEYFNSVCWNIICITIIINSSVESNDIFNFQLPVVNYIHKSIFRKIRVNVFYNYCAS